MEQNMELLDKSDIQEMLRFKREIIYKKLMTIIMASA